jgi:hypothetical protein
LVGDLECIILHGLNQDGRLDEWYGHGSAQMTERNTSM